MRRGAALTLRRLAVAAEAATSATASSSSARLAPAAAAALSMRGAASAAAPCGAAALCCAPRPWAAAPALTPTPTPAQRRAFAASASGHEVAQKVLAADTASVGPELMGLVEGLEPAGLPAVTRAAAVTGISDRAFLDALAAAAVHAMPELPASDLCSLAESFSDLRCYSIGFKDAMSVNVLKRLDDFSGDMLGHVLRSFAEMEYFDDELLEGVVAHVAAHPEKFSAENIADVVWAFSKCGFCHPDLVTVVARAADTLLRDAAAHRGEAIASILDAYSNVGCTEPEVVDQLVAKVGENSHAFDGACLGKIVVATIRLGYEDQQLLEPLLTQTTAKLGDLSARAIARLVTTLADLGYLHRPLLDRVTDEVVPERLQEFHVESLSDMVHALNKLGYYNREFMSLMRRVKAGPHSSAELAEEESEAAKLQQPAMG